MPSSTKPASSVLIKRLSCLRKLFARRYADWNIGKIYERVGNPTKAEVINVHCSRSHAHKNWQTSLLRQNNNGILVMLESNVLLSSSRVKQGLIVQEIDWVEDAN